MVQRRLAEQRAGRCAVGVVVQALGWVAVAYFFVVVLLGFVYVEDVRHGIGVLSSQVVEWIFPDLML